MSTILILSGSPTSPSRTDGVLGHIARRLAGAGHQVQTLVLRDLPATPLLAADTSDPAIAAAVQQLLAADAVVVGSPIYQAAYSGITKVFLDLLPQFAFRGKAVLPVVTGGSPAHVLAVDYALRPVLAGLGASHIGQGWFVLAGHVRLFPDGGVLLDPASAGPLADVTDAFIRHLAATSPAPAVPVTPVDPGTGTPAPRDGLEVRRVVGDPELEPLLTDLVVEYGTRYSRISANTQLSEVPATDFEGPDGAFLVLLRDGETVAGGAIRRRDDDTAEIKRVWTSHRHRRQGLARLVIEELEAAAVELGYRQAFLTTGPRQPEARALYLAAGYLPEFDVDADPESIGPLPFRKTLPFRNTPPRTVSGAGSDRRATFAGAAR